MIVLHINIRVSLERQKKHRYKINGDAIRKWIRNGMFHVKHIANIICYFNTFL